MKDNNLEIFVSAILMSPKLLLTGTQYVSIIQTTFTIRDLEYPQYTVCIHNTKANTVSNNIPLKEVVFLDKTSKSVAPQYEKLGLLIVSHQMLRTTLLEISTVIFRNS